MKGKMTTSFSCYDHSSLSLKYMSKVERKHLKKLDKIIDALQLGDPIIVPVRKKEVK